MQYQLVDASQMWGEFESFRYNRNVCNVCCYRNLSFLPAPHLIWGIDYQILGKAFLPVLKKVNAEGKKFLCLYPLSEKVLGRISSKVGFMKFCNKSWLDIPMLWSFKVGHPPLYVTFSVCPSVANHISETVHHLIIIFVHMCKMMTSPSAFLISFEILYFWAVLGLLFWTVKRKKISQNEKQQLHVSHAISQVHLCKMMTSPGVFFIVLRFSFLWLLAG